MPITSFKFYNISPYKCSQLKGNFIYITGGDSNYLKGIIALKKSLNLVNSKFDLLCLSYNLKDDEIKKLEALDILIKKFPVEKIKNPYFKRWDLDFAKLFLWSYLEYDKICWIDSDIILLKNIDEVFNIPITKNEIIASPANINPFLNNYDNKIYFNSFGQLQCGLFILKPNLYIYNDLNKKLGILNSVDGSCQGFFSSYFKKNIKFICSSYNYVKRGLIFDKDFNLDKIKALHYVGHPKPWIGCEKGYEKLQPIWENIYNDKIILKNEDKSEI